MPLTRSTLAVTAALALALAACSKGSTDGNGADMAPPALPATLPMATGAATNPTLAPSAAALPAQRIATARVANPRDAYAYADQAADYAGALEDAPPDYGFGYDGVEPWAWQDANGYRMFAEPIDDGYRYYYYRPGADTPYYVRDPDYGYGYDGARLAAIYTLAGAILPYADYGPRLGYGGAYWARGRALYQASLADERRAVIAANWAARSAAIAQSDRAWIAARERQADWNAYHLAQASRYQGFWAGEEARRQADAQRFAAWHRDDFQGPPPPRAIPARWQDAKWARNRASYAPIAPVDQRDHFRGAPAGAPPAEPARPAARDFARGAPPPAGPAAGPPSRPASGGMGAHPERQPRGPDRGPAAAPRAEAGQPRPGSQALAPDRRAGAAPAQRPTIDRAGPPADRRSHQAQSAPGPAPRQDAAPRAMPAMHAPRNGGGAPRPEARGPTADRAPPQAMARPAAPHEAQPRPAAAPRPAAQPHSAAAQPHPAAAQGHPGGGGNPHEHH